MAKFNTTIVTNAGKELFAKVRAGKEQLTWTKAQMYYASNSDSLPKEMLQQATPDYFGGALKETNVGVVDIKGTTVTITSSFLNENQLSDLTFNLVGWFANSSLDQEEKLVAITPSVNDQVLTAGATDGKATASIDLVLAIDVGDANIVKITPIEEGLIDHTELNNALALLASKGLINTGNDITSNQNINLDEHFNTSLQYINDALNDITSTFGSSFSGKGWLMSFGNHENKNNQNNVQLLFDTDHNNQDGYIQHQILFRYFNADYNMWTGWDSLITANNINNFFPGSLSWLDVDNNKPRSVNYIRYGSYGAGMFLPPFLNKLTYSANDENRLKKDNVIVDLDTLLINHAQLMQELGNYYTKNDADQKFETKLDAMKFAKSSDVYTKIQSDEKYYDKQTTDYNIANAIVIQNREGLQKYKLETIDESSVSGRYILAGTAQHPTNLPNIPQLNSYESIYLEVHNEGMNAKPFVKVIPTDDKSKFYSNYLFRFYIGTFDRSGAINWYSYASDDNYYDKKTIDEKIDNAGQVKTVNNVKPDDKGNVQISVPDSYTKQETDDKFESKYFVKISDMNKMDKVIDYGIPGKYYIYGNGYQAIPKDIVLTEGYREAFLENNVIKDSWLGNVEIKSENKVRVLQILTIPDGSVTYKRVLTMDFEYNPDEEQKSSSSGMVVSIKPTITNTGWYKYSGTKVE